MAKKPDRPAVPFRTAIVVLGMHRSGTSALARVVSFLGAALPRHLVPASESNPRGQWESAPLVGLHDNLLAELGSSWNDWRAPPLRWRDGEPAARFAGRIQFAIDEEFGNAPLFVLKDPRICRTLPYWMTVLEKAGARTAPLIILRNPLEVAESLRDRDGISFEKALLIWLRHYLDAEAETRHLSRNILTLDALLEDWKLIAVQSAARLGLTWPRQPLDASQDVRDFLDPDLHNHRATLAELEAHTEVPSWVKRAYRALIQLCDEPKAAEPKRELDRVRTLFGESARIFGGVAFEQTEALRQAGRDVAQARSEAQREADEARRLAVLSDGLRADLGAERATLGQLQDRHAALVASSRQSEALLVSRAESLERELGGLRADSDAARAAAEAFRTETEGTILALRQQLAASTADAGRFHVAADEGAARAALAEARVAGLLEELAELERSRNEAHQMLRQVTADAVELRTLADHVTQRTAWIEGELRKQDDQQAAVRAETEALKAKLAKASSELQAALSNAMTLTQELAAARQQLHGQETAALKAGGELNAVRGALQLAEQRIVSLEAALKAASEETSDLRSELAEAWAMGGNQAAPDDAPAAPPPFPAPLEVLPPETRAQADAELVAQQAEEDLRLERARVRQLEGRLNSWSGLAGAALRKVTRLGNSGATSRRQRHALSAPPAPSRT